MEVFAIIASPLIAAIVAVLVPILQRKWKKDDDKDTQSKEIMKKLTELSSKMDIVENKLSSISLNVTTQQMDLQNLSDEFHAYKIDDEDAFAKQIRVRILRADDDLCNPNLPYPSEGYFEQIMLDCDEYEAHVEKRKKQNKEFKNGIASSSITHIRSEYAKVRANRL